VTATRIEVRPSDGGLPYPVVVGVGILGELPGLVPKEASTVVVIHPESLGEIARPACGALRAAGLVVHAEPVPDGEAAKTIEVASGLWSRLAGHKVTRSDCVVGLGGGAATDLAGFVAASWLRGIAVVLVPTTLLGMADAAVGGKTAIDIPEGKNLVGAFHSPAGVLADLATLETLPRADYTSGLAEVIKAGFIADPAILDLVQSDPEGATVPHGRHARELIERAISVKAEVVSNDLTEHGRREILNYGHTLGHAIERVEGYRFRHGEAVAIGLVYVAELARLAGRLDEQTCALHRTVLASVGLPTAYRPGVWPSLREAMSVDKKSRSAASGGRPPQTLPITGGDPPPVPPGPPLTGENGSPCTPPAPSTGGSPPPAARTRLRLVVLDGLARPAILDDPPEALLWRAYREVSR
jgi:3-dehydroquinate synthase